MASSPGANAELRPEDVELPDCDGVLCQLEIPLETVEHVARTAPGYFFLNAAPARGAVPAADLTIVNRYELEALTHRNGVIAVTLGAIWAFAVGKAWQVRGRPVSVGPQMIAGAVGEVRRDGLVFVNGELWQARTTNGEQLKPGDHVRVESLDGLVLNVKPV